MCQELTTMAKSNDFRFITRCEHGTIHMTWDLMTVYLDEETFAALVETLVKGAALSKPGKVRHKHCHLFYQTKEYYQVWVRNVALNLSPADFLILVDLAQMAWATLPQAKKLTFSPAPEPLWSRPFKGPNPPHFSLN